MSAEVTQLTALTSSAAILSVLVPDTEPTPVSLNSVTNEFWKGRLLQKTACTSNMKFFVHFTNLKTGKDNNQKYQQTSKHRFTPPQATLCCLLFRKKWSLRLPPWLFNKDYLSWFAFHSGDKHHDQQQLRAKRGLFQFTFPRLPSNIEGR